MGRCVCCVVGVWVGTGLGTVVGFLVAGKETIDVKSTLTDWPNTFVTDDVNATVWSVPPVLEARSPTEVVVVVARDTTAVNETSQLYASKRRRL
jgi:hypothetical protein